MMINSNIQFEYDNINPEVTSQARVLNLPTQDTNLPIDTITEEINENSETINSDVQNISKKKWYHEAVLSLIYVYKKKWSDLKNCLKRNDTIWKEVSVVAMSKWPTYHHHEHQFSPEQCKWKYGSCI